MSCKSFSQYCVIECEIGHYMGTQTKQFLLLLNDVFRLMFISHWNVEGLY